MRGTLPCLAFLLLTVAPSAHAAETQPHRIALSAGVFTSRDHSPSGVGLVEYRSAYSLLGGETYLNPMAGFLGNSDGGVYGYVGLRLGFPLSDDWHWENAFGFGAYGRGNGPDLYDPFEFCLAFSITRRMHRDLRLGLQLFHISNAGLRDMDPGANSVVALLEFGL
jgi:hypothetical protein